MKKPNGERNTYIESGNEIMENYLPSFRTLPSAKPTAINFWFYPENL